MKRIVAMLNMALLAGAATVHDTCSAASHDFRPQLCVAQPMSFELKAIGCTSFVWHAESQQCKAHCEIEQKVLTTISAPSTDEEKLQPTHAWGGSPNVRVVVVSGGWSKSETPLFGVITVPGGASYLPHADKLHLFKWDGSAATVELDQSAFKAISGASWKPRKELWKSWTPDLKWPIEFDTSGRLKK